jgi:hypothetical protein
VCIEYLIAGTTKLPCSPALVVKVLNVDPIAKVPLFQAFPGIGTLLNAWIMWQKLKQHLKATSRQV